MSLVEYIDPFTGEPVKKKTRNKLLGAVVGNQSKPAKPLWGAGQQESEKTEPLGGGGCKCEKCSWQIVSAPSGRKQE